MRPLHQQNEGTPAGPGLLHNTRGRVLLPGRPAAGLARKVGHSQRGVPGFCGRQAKLARASLESCTQRFQTLLRPSGFSVKPRGRLNLTAESYSDLKRQLPNRARRGKPGSGLALTTLLYVRTAWQGRELFPLHLRDIEEGVTGQGSFTRSP